MSCPAFAGLPNYLTIINNLNLHNCPIQRFLPNKLEVGGTLCLGNLSILEIAPETLVSFAYQHLQSGGNPNKIITKFLGLQSYPNLMEKTTKLLSEFKAALNDLLTQIKHENFSFSDYFNQNRSQAFPHKMLLSEEAVEAVEALRSSRAYQVYTLDKCAKRLASQQPSYFCVARRNNNPDLPTLSADIQLMIRSWLLRPHLRASQVPDPLENDQ